MRTLYPLAVLLLSLALLGCRSAPPPDNGPGVHVNVPGVNVDVRTDR
jgi:hypothetical protein